MNPVVHFEMPYTNADRISTFYKNVFGWKLQSLGEQANGYILAITAEKDVKQGFPAGAINGGFYETQPEWHPHYPSIVIGVEDIQSTMQAIKDNGGIIIKEPVLIPNFGMYVSFLDTEKNRNSIIQPMAM